MKNIAFVTCLFMLLCVTADAQVGINILIPDSSAVLQLESVTKGLGLSRLTTTQRDGIANPLRGLTIFNTQDSLIEYFNGECWLKAYEKNCYECAFNMSLDHNTDTLDRTFGDSVFTTVNILQTNGQQPIEVSWVAAVPSGVQVYMGGSGTIDSTGTVTIVVKADVFAEGGIVPILITSVCDDKIRILTYNVYIKPCIKIIIPQDYTNYDLQALNSAVLPAGARECIILTVYPGVEVTSGLPTAPSYTTGNLNPLSILGVNNSGYFLGRGGNGGDFSGNVVGGVPGQDGGNAMNLTTRTIMNNFGGIYAGGGGGASIGLSTSFSVLGLNFTLGVGAGGGGGAEAGLGGAPPSGIVLGQYYGGNDATTGNTSVAGLGGSFNIPITISFSGASIIITPTGAGGNGGNFGQAGTQGNLGACFGIGVFGFNINLGCFSASVFSPGGLPGLAVKRNSNPLLNLPDGSYSNNQVKGVVAP